MAPAISLACFILAASLLIVKTNPIDHADWIEYLKNFGLFFYVFGPINDAFLFFRRFIGFPVNFDEDKLKSKTKHMSYNIQGVRPEGEETKEYWLNQNLLTLKNKLENQDNRNKAKNIIFFIGDGMSLATVVSSRVYKGQTSGMTGEENSLFFEKFPHTGLSKTYCVDMQVADSACTGTAYWSGVKTNFGALGVTASVPPNDTFCRTMDDSTTLKTLLDWSQAEGKATGIVTNTRITDASPAAGYAKVPNRNMEYDKEIELDENNTTNCVDIAKQLVTLNPGKNLNVIMGGGRDYFLLQDSNSAVYPNGKRKDVNLIEEWKSGKKNAQFISSKTEMNRLKIEETDYLLGLFSDSHMPYEDDRNDETPSLSEMTQTAVNMLKKSKNGFFLFVEGGKIDQAHHGTWAMRALSETVEFSNAIQYAYENTNPEETLIVVTADHAHTLTFSGYPERGADVLGYAGLDEKGSKYTILGYANGPNQERKKYSKTMKNEYFAGVPKHQETHSGEDVPVYATGPWSHFYSGAYEQSFIPTVMSYAACFGDYAQDCHTQ